MTLNKEILVQMEKEVNVFVKRTQQALQGVNVLGSNIKVQMPKGSINDILARHIEEGKQSLIKEGLPVTRAKSLARETLKSYLEEIMKKIQG